MQGKGGIKVDWGGTNIRKQRGKGIKRATLGNSCLVSMLI